MLSHSGMLDIAESVTPIARCNQGTEKAWEDWKEHEGKNR